MGEHTIAPILQIILGATGVIVSVCAPLFLFILNTIKTDLRDTNAKLDSHIANYEIHKGGNK